MVPPSQTHGPEPWSAPPQNHGPENLRLGTGGYRKEHKSGCRGDFRTMVLKGADHGSGPWFCEGVNHAGTGNRAFS